MSTIPTGEPLAVVEAIHSGDLKTLKQLLDENPGLAATRLDAAQREGADELVDWLRRQGAVISVERILQADPADPQKRTADL